LIKEFILGEIKIYLYIYSSKFQYLLIVSTVIPDCFIQSRQLFYSLIGLDGCYIAANSLYIRHFDYDEEMITEVRALDSVHPDDREICRSVTEWCIMHPEQPRSVTLRKRCQGSGYCFIKWEMTFLPGGANGQPAVQCIGVDISNEISIAADARHLKEEIVSGQKLFENILSNSIDIVLLVHPDGEIFFCTPNIEAVLGYSREEMMSQNGFAFVHPEDKERALHIFSEELERPNQNHSIDVRFRKKDGTWLWAEAKGRNLLHDPFVKGVLININDISYRKKAEQALQKSENRYKSFFDNLPQPIFLVVPGTKRIINANAKALSEYGYTIGELQQMSLYDLFEQKPSFQQLDTYFSDHTPVRHLHKNGHRIIVKLERFTIQLDDSGYRLILIHDITDTYYKQEEAKLSYEISRILMQNTSIHENLKTALRKIRQFTGWDLLELWTPLYDLSSIKNEISDYETGHKKEAAVRQFIEASRQSMYSKDRYGNTPSFQTMNPYWIEDLAADTNLVRRDLALEAGFRSVLSVPIINEGHFVCAFYFFSFDQKPQHTDTEKLITTLGSLIGTEIEKVKREKVLECFFSISPDIITIATLSGHYLKVNPAFERFTGYTEAEARQFHPLHYVHADDREQVLEQLRQLSEGKAVVNFENRIVAKSGEVKWISWTATPVFEEGMVIATHRDITEQKQSAELMRQVNERYELVTKAMTNEAIWDLDIVNGWVTRSEVYTKLFGYHNLQEKTDMGFWEDHIHPADRGRVTTSIHAFLNQKETAHWYCEYRFRRSDGSYAYIIDRSYMILDRDGKPVRVVGAMEDITERKHLEDELIQQERSRQKQIAQAAVDAQEKERADIGKELHDNISQMLTSTKLFLDILRNKTPDELLDRSVKNINSIIQEIRNLSRSLVPSSIEDLGLIASLNDLMDNIRATGIVDFEFYPAMETEQQLSSNAKLTLYRIVQEQINNIVRHAEATHVIIELFPENGTVELLITDDGKGFDVETIRRGMGLKNIKSRAELLNGSAELITAPGKGCKLKVVIPVI